MAGNCIWPRRPISRWRKDRREREPARLRRNFFSIASIFAENPDVAVFDPCLSSQRCCKIALEDCLTPIKSTMALSELEIKRCEKLVAEFISKRRPPPHIRAKLDFGFRISGQSIEIFEIRPRWRDESKMYELPVAKATYNNKKLKWKIFWQRADEKWHGYQPNPEVASVEEFPDIVHNDKYNCFFG